MSIVNNATIETPKATAVRGQTKDTENGARTVTYPQRGWYLGTRHTDNGNIR